MREGFCCRPSCVRYEPQIKQWVAEQADITLAEFGVRLAKKEIPVGKSSIARFLDHLDLTFKNKVCKPNTIDQTWPQPVGHGAEPNPGAINAVSYSSTKPAWRQT
jgi:transposase